VSCILPTGKLWQPAPCTSTMGAACSPRASRWMLETFEEQRSTTLPEQLWRQPFSSDSSGALSDETCRRVPFDRYVPSAPSPHLSDGALELASSARRSLRPTKSSHGDITRYHVRATHTRLSAGEADPIWRHQVRFGPSCNRTLSLQRPRRLNRHLMSEGCDGPRLAAGSDSVTQASP
jgi:hypothetical protein